MSKGFSCCLLLGHPSTITALSCCNTSLLAVVAWRTFCSFASVMKQYLASAINSRFALNDVCTQSISELGCFLLVGSRCKYARNNVSAISSSSLDGNGSECCITSSLISIRGSRCGVACRGLRTIISKG